LKVGVWGFRFEGSGIRFKLKGIGSRAWGVWFWIWGLGFSLGVPDLGTGGGLVFGLVLIVQGCL